MVDVKSNVMIKESHIILDRDGWMNEWLAISCLFSTVFLSYEDNWWMIMKGCVQWNPVYDLKDLRLKRGTNPGPIDK